MTSFWEVTYVSGQSGFTGMFLGSVAAYEWGSSAAARSPLGLFVDPRSVSL